MNFGTIGATLPETQIYASNASPPQDWMTTLKSSLPNTAASDKTPSYGLDSPLGLVASLFFAPFYLYCSLKGKHDAWDKMLSSLPTETHCGPSLDLGCGRGMVLFKTALQKQAVATKVSKNSLTCYGIDIFSSGDQTGNSPEATYRNAQALGLVDQVVLHSVSFAERLPFCDGAFTLVTASLSIHNVTAVERQTAVREAARVCAPGGRMLILDLAQYVGGYAKTLKQMGWTDVTTKFAGPEVIFGVVPCWWLVAQCPGR